MDYSRFSGEIPSDSFVLNAKLALQLADDDAPTLADLQVADTGNRFLLRRMSKSTPTLSRPASKAGWSRIPDLNAEDDIKKLHNELLRPVRRQQPDAPGSAVRLFLRRSIHGCLKKPRDCVGCRALIAGDAVRLICGHFFEKPCLVSMVRTCLSSESLFPPKCCDQPIPKAAFEPLMDAALATLYAEKSMEYGTLERVYCARAACRRFLGPQAKGIHHVYTCPAPGCGTRTCSRCKIEVKKAVLHACRPDLPRKPSVSSQKPLVAQAPARPEPKAKPPPPPLTRKPTQVKKTSSFQSLESITKAPILAVARKISQSLKAPSTISLDNRPSKGKSSPTPLVKRVPSNQSIDDKTKSPLVRKASHSLKPPPASPPSPPRSKFKPPPPPPPPKPQIQIVQAAPLALSDKPKSKPPPPPPPPKPVQVRAPPPPVPPRVGEMWIHISAGASPPRAGPLPPRSPPRPSQPAPPPRHSPPLRPVPPAPPPRTITPAAPPPVPNKPRRHRTSAPAEPPRDQGRHVVREHAVEHGHHAHAHERRVRRHETAPPYAPPYTPPYAPPTSNHYPHSAQPPRPFAAPRKGSYEAPPRRVAEPLTPVGAHRLTMLDAHVDRMLRVVECYPCRHEWRVDLKREVCDTCARRCVVIYGCTKCVTKLCKECQMRRG